MKKVLLVICFLFVSALAQAEVLVIVNESVSDTTLTRQNIKDIFLGNKLHWADKSRIHFALLSDGEANREFLNTYINKSPRQYNSYLEKKLFTSPNKAPKSFPTSKKLMEYVSSTPGAIGYVDTKIKLKHVIPLSIE